MIWHPHTEAPGSAQNAVIAIIDPEGYACLIGFAESHLGRWVSEETGVPYEAPFFWMDERELVSTIPVTENRS